MPDSLPRNPCLARFIFDHSCIRRDGSVKHKAFLETRPPHNTSVDAHAVLTRDIHWDIGRKINPQRPLVGAADLPPYAAESTGLSVVHDPKPGMESHCELHGWPDDRMKMIEIAASLAERSVFVGVA